MLVSPYAIDITDEGKFIYVCYIFSIFYVCGPFLKTCIHGRRVQGEGSLSLEVYGSPPGADTCPLASHPPSSAVQRLLSLQVVTKPFL